MEFTKVSAPARSPAHWPAISHERGRQAQHLRCNDGLYRQCRLAVGPPWLGDCRRLRNRRGLLLVLGFRARVVAFAMAVFVLATAVFFHRNFADQNQIIHFLKNIMIIGGLLQIAHFGAGRYSLDARNLKGVAGANT